MMSKAVLTIYQKNGSGGGRDVVKRERVGKSGKERDGWRPENVG